MDGSSSEASQLTSQNEILSFNPKWLDHVDVVEPLPAFPVGSK